MENKVKHLEFIQAVINRTAKNSFLLKGWSITVVAALFALSTDNSVLNHILIAYFIVFIFWLLDSYYLCQERLFRALYNYVRCLEKDKIDFSMDVKNFSNEKNCKWFDSLLSKTLLMFYLPLMIIILLMYLIK